MLRILFWNIMAGGGKRAEAIIAQMLAWSPDVIALSEFRGTPASISIAAALRETGFPHQLTTADKEDYRSQNALLLASRLPVGQIEITPSPEPAERWLLATVAVDVPFYIGVMHIPNMHTGKKVPYHEAVLSLAEAWDQGPGLFIGDTNSGIPDIDEESPAFGRNEEYFMRQMDNLGWRDIFRVLHGDERAYTWYSPNGRNGFRLDQAFVNAQMIDQVMAFQYVWGTAAGYKQLSDHAAILLDVDLDHSGS